MTRKILLCLLVFLFLYANSSEAQTLRVCSVAAVRGIDSGWTLDGAQMSGSSRLKLLNTANFGHAGTVPFSISIVDTFSTVGSITASSLASNSCNVLFIGWLSDTGANALTAAELSAIVNWAQSGGILISSCDDSTHDAVCSQFGYTTTATTTAANIATTAGALHPIFAGIFGIFSTINSTGAYSRFGAISGVDVLAISSDGTSLPSLIETRTDKDIFVVDVDWGTAFGGVSTGATINTSNVKDLYWTNLFAYLGKNLFSPRVTTVTSPNSNGAYGIGSSITVQVAFSEPVYVSGSPRLTLETGVTDRIASYSSGSGTNVLAFTYTVVSGDSSSDLDYLSTTALALNAGTIKDVSENNASLTLVSPGAARSLGANKALVIDTASPVILTPANGSTTNDSTPNVSGTGQAGYTVTVKEGALTLCTATVAVAGTWNCNSSVLTNASHTISATQALGAGPASAAASTVFTVDTIAPVAPVISIPVVSASVADPTPTISGTGERDAAITVKEGTTTLCATTADTLGAWSCESTVVLSVASHTISVTQTDAGGNISPAATRTFTVSSTAPSVTLSVNNANIAEASGVATFTATLSATSSQTVTINFTFTGTATGSGMDYSISSSSISISAGSATGTMTVTAAQDVIDEANETVVVEISSIVNATESGIQQRTTTITDDDGGLVVTIPANSSIVRNEPFSISGIGASPSSNVRICLNSGLLATVTADGSGNWSYSPALGLVRGINTIGATTPSIACNDIGISTIQVTYLPRRVFNMD